MYQHCFNVIASLRSNPEYWYLRWIASFLPMTGKQRKPGKLDTSFDLLFDFNNERFAMTI